MKIVILHSVETSSNFEIDLQEKFKFTDLFCTTNRELFWDSEQTKNHYFNCILFVTYQM
jgi:hypothetical protein